MGCLSNYTILILFVIINLFLIHFINCLSIPKPLVHGRHLRAGPEPDRPARVIGHENRVAPKILSEEEKEFDPERPDSDDIEKLRQSVLQGLGMSRIPDVSKMNVSQEEYSRMYQVYLDKVRERTLREATENDIEEKIFQQFYTFKKSDCSSSSTTRERRSIHHRSRLINFSLDLPNFSIVDDATMRLLISTPHAAQLSPILNLKVYQVGERGYRKLLDHRDFAAGPQWIDLDVTSATWSTGNQSLSLEIECADCEKHSVTYVSTGSPVLNALVTESSNTRDKRSAEHFLASPHKTRRTDCQKDNKKCCRHEMDVTFKNLTGFDFIIQPKNFDAGYCKGRCPPRYNPAHRHALLQSLIWKQDRSRAPRLCCAASKLGELEVLHVDEDDSTKLKVSSWEEMRVLDCACS